MKIHYSKQAVKYLTKLQAKKMRKIREVLRMIADGKTDGLNITTLQGINAYRVRIGEFRVIYEMNDKELVLIVIKVGARGDVYE